MKTIMRIATVMAMCLFLLGIGNAIAKEDTKTETVKVYGNCGMCKETIEDALKKKDGVLKKDWNKDTKMLKVTYDPTKISMAQIKQKVAAAGYDTDDVRAKDEDYNGLHKCCQYERPGK